MPYRTRPHRLEIIPDLIEPEPGHPPQPVTQVVQALALLFQVTPETVKTDIAYLENTGVIERWPGQREDLLPEDRMSQPLPCHCPSCGNALMSLLSTGHLRCEATGCPEPDALERILADPRLHEHVVRVSSHGTWTIKHPLAERLDDRLFDCDLARYMNDEDPVGSHVIEPGRQYTASGYVHFRFRDQESPGTGPHSTWQFALIGEGGDDRLDG